MATAAPHRAGWRGATLAPGKILWEVQEAYQPAIVKEKLTLGPLEYGGQARKTFVGPAAEA
jgi:hypothetical protein